MRVIGKHDVACHALLEEILRQRMSPHSRRLQLAALHARQQSVLQSRPASSAKALAVGSLRFGIERLEAEPPGLAVARHPGEPIAVRVAVVQLVDRPVPRPGSADAPPAAARCEPRSRATVWNSSRVKNRGSPADRQPARDDAARLFVPGGPVRLARRHSRDSGSRSWRLWIMHRDDPSSSRARRGRRAQGRRNSAAREAAAR